MFAGKTTRLIEMFNYSSFLDAEKLSIKPLMDNRYQAEKINTHSGLQIPGHRISKPEEIYPLLGEAIKEVYMDEIQFFSENMITIISELNYRGIKVVAAGLDKDYLGRDFGIFPLLVKMATERIELKAKCEICGNVAAYTHRKVDSNELLLIAGKEIYTARCQTHWLAGLEIRS